MSSTSKTSAHATGRAAPCPVLSAPVPPPNYLKKVLPAWEAAHSCMTETSRRLKIIDRKITVVGTTVAQLPDSDTKKTLTEQARVLHNLMKQQLKTKRKKYETSTLCMTAFGNTKLVPLGESGLPFTELFWQVLNSAPEDTNVRDLPKALATNTVLVKANQAADSSSKAVNKNQEPSAANGTEITRIDKARSSNARVATNHARRTTSSAPSTRSFNSTHIVTVQTTTRPQPPTHQGFGGSKPKIRTYTQSQLAARAQRAKEEAEKAAERRVDSLFEDIPIAEHMTQAASVEGVPKQANIVQVASSLVLDPSTVSPKSQTKSCDADEDTPKSNGAINSNVDEQASKRCPNINTAADEATEFSGIDASRPKPQEAMSSSADEEGPAEHNLMRHNKDPSLTNVNHGTYPISESAPKHTARSEISTSDQREAKRQSATHTHPDDAAQVHGGGASKPTKNRTRASTSSNAGTTRKRSGDDENSAPSKKRVNQERDIARSTSWIAPLTEDTLTGPAVVPEPKVSPWYHPGFRPTPHNVVAFDDEYL